MKEFPLRRHLSGLGMDMVGNCAIQTPLASSPRIRKSPYFERTEQHRCQAYTVYNRMLLPLFFDHEREYKALTQDVALWDVAAQRQVEIRGRDAENLTQLLTCRHIRDMRVGECRYALMCDESGRVINDPVLLKLSPDHYWLSIADADVLLWAKAWASAKEMRVTVSEPDVSPLAVQGPRSVDLVRDLFPHTPRVHSLRKFGFVETELAGIPLVVARSGWSPERGYELYLRDSSHGPQLWDLVWAAGRKYNIFPGAPNQTRRIEAGLLSFGGDTLPRTNALELGLPPKFVDIDQSDNFLGKRALRRIQDQGGPRHTLVTLRLVTRDGPRADVSRFPYFNGDRLPVFDDHGRVAGAVTAVSPLVSVQEQCHVAMGMIDTRLGFGVETFGVEMANGQRGRLWATVRGCLHK